jgi:hypothetical protein
MELPVQLGELRAIVVGHNGTGPGMGWLVDRIKVVEAGWPQRSWLFYADRWLDVDKGDGLLQIELSAVPCQ